MAVDAPPAVAGTVLPEGRYTIEDWADMLLCDNLDTAEAPDGGAHPLFGYIATQCGIGIGITELCALADFDVADGPMLASVDLTLHEQPRVGVEYRVTGEIEDIVRKQGRKAGTFDLMTFVERLHGPDDAVVAECRNVFVLPRRSVDAGA